jgi:hypothetical protein
LVTKVEYIIKHTPVKYNLSASRCRARITEAGAADRLEQPQQRQRASQRLIFTYIGDLPEKLKQVLGLQNATGQ